MRLDFLDLPPAERQIYFEQAAGRLGLHPAILEKDFWVCWLLGVLFSHPTLRKVVVFKGGTSLSKVHAAIRRFSEDIDLAIAPAFLGAAEDELEPSASRSKTDRWITHLQSLCGQKVQSDIQAVLEDVARQTLGPRPKNRPWLEYILDHTTNSPVLLFHYPTPALVGFPYLVRSVKLEFGSLTDQQPVGQHPIQPWLADVFPHAFGDWQCNVVALDIQRTFWEKATILHAEYHRRASAGVPERYSRHYADVAALTRHTLAKQAISQVGLLEQVVAWKSRFFARGSARYDLAQPGTFRFAPPPGRMKELQSDYAAMRPMYFDEPLSFDEVVAILEQLEREFNDAGS